jgi:cytochrome c oxidase subunit 2
MSFSKACAALCTALTLSVAGPALADKPRPWQMGLQDAATPTMEKITDFHNLLLVIITVITLFVLGLLIYVMVRFRASRNPVPSKTTHNTWLEIAWTVVPVFILLGIAWPSFELLYFADRTENAELTVKATGHQWYWTYEYPDQDGLEFDSVMVAEEDLEEGQLRLLTTDTKVVVPVNTNVRMLITADDVLHSWAIPAFGVKLDAVPGRVNETWFRATREGTFYGQCSELCGVNHGFMPIMVEVVSKEAFESWLVEAKKEFASRDQAPAERIAAVIGR